MPRHSRTSNRALFPKGGELIVSVGLHRVRVAILEDRGPVGSRGRHLLEVRNLEENDTLERTFSVVLDPSAADDVVVPAA
jgi:hypothetical protein